MTFGFTRRFTTEFKKLLKKYHHAENDFDGFIANFEKNHQVSKTIKNIFDKLILNIKNIWSKFVNALDDFIKNDVEYLKKYRETIIGKPLKLWCIFKRL